MSERWLEVAAGDGSAVAAPSAEPGLRSVGEPGAVPGEAAAVPVGAALQAGEDGGSGGRSGRRRRRLQGEGVRSAMLRVRVSPAEQAVITEAAARVGMSTGAWLAGLGLRAAATGPVGRPPVAGEPAVALAEPERGCPGAGSVPVSSADVAVEALREAVGQLRRYGVLLNQLVAAVNAGGDVADLAGGLRIAVDRCGQRSAAVATRAGELAALASSPESL